MLEDVQERLVYRTQVGSVFLLIMKFLIIFTHFSSCSIFVGDFEHLITRYFEKIHKKLVLEKNTCTGASFLKQSRL